LAILERLVGSSPADGAVGEALDSALAADLTRATRALAALVAFDADAVDAADSPLRRALLDELDLVAQRVAAACLARHGSAALGPAMVELRAGGRGVPM